MSYGFAYITNNFTNFSVQAEFQFPTNAYGGGLGGRLNTTSGAHYAAWIYPENSAGGPNVMKLLRFDSYSSFAVLQQTSLSAVGTNAHTLKLEFSGSLINVYFDSSKLISATDSTYGSGSISLDMWTHDTTYQMTVDNVVVSALPLVANNDSYSVASGSVLTVAAPGVLGNDAGGNGPLSAVLVSGTGNGTLSLNSNGGFTYTPTNSLGGTDTFTYRATDGQSNSTPATVTISVISSLYSDEFNRTTLSPWIASRATGGHKRRAARRPERAKQLRGGLPAEQLDELCGASQRPAPGRGLRAGIDACLDTATGARYAAWIYPEGSGGGANTLKLIKFQTYTSFAYNGIPDAVMQSVSLGAVGTGLIR